MSTTAKTKSTDKHPYMSGTAGLMQAAAQFRKSFPTPITADTLKKLGIASNNESYVLNILRFVGVLDTDGNKTDAAASIFNQHEDGDFQDGFGSLVKSAYSELFNLHSDEAWSLPSNKLISFFRNSDHTSAIVGQRQASTFQALAVLSGRLDSAAKAQSLKSSKPKDSHSAGASLATKIAPKKQVHAPEEAGLTLLPSSAHKPKQNDGADVGLTVRIEINLPASGDQATYDRIFKSIRENLLNAKNS